ncbi:hypothetical protein [Leeuwenhoekiella nanhaiensis]|uniref:Lipoprotein n=1 Tax=Leeuwenhoekiella nanhaiensis TaxID=1655491 RepID=A0A2G1VPT1_9FLAO|nr:hypothetical protein [Leeuwenhoekiella nanhaiensis]PHQ28776.1 hypothetical protein CJ305_13235 [Leeuwenhoekiella nanhaiensis]
MYTLRNISLGMVLLFFSCEKNNEQNPTESAKELFITTVTYTLTPEGEGTILSSSCYDSDGFDGRFVSDCTLSGVGEYNTTYLGSVRFLNENVEPAEDYTEYIIENGLHYQVLFGSYREENRFTYEYLPPFDANGDPIGINFKIYTSNEDCVLRNLSLDMSGTLKAISRKGKGLGGEIYTGGIIANGGMNIGCNPD